MLKSYNFPSVYEATNQELANVAENILDGLKINLDDTDYIVGNLALVEGYSPHKSINAAPTDEEYKLLRSQFVAYPTERRRGNLSDDRIPVRNLYTLPG